MESVGFDQVRDGPEPDMRSRHGVADAWRWSWPWFRGASASQARLDLLTHRGHVGAPLELGLQSRHDFAHVLHA